jgi:hypothetical protein
MEGARDLPKSAPPGEQASTLTEVAVTTAANAQRI